MQIFYCQMRVVRNNLIPFRGFAAINLFGVIFVRQEAIVSDTLINHERIHTAQMRELGYLLFYILYILEWIMRLMFPGNAYYNLTFEREAYLYQNDLNYLSHRKSFSMWRTRQ